MAFKVSIDNTGHRVKLQREGVPEEHIEPNSGLREFFIGVGELFHLSIDDPKEPEVQTPVDTPLEEKKADESTSEKIEVDPASGMGSEPLGPVEQATQPLAPETPVVQGETQVATTEPEPEHIAKLKELGSTTSSSAAKDEPVTVDGGTIDPTPTASLDELKNSGTITQVGSVVENGTTSVV